jgi:hypothetical protein
MFDITKPAAVASNRHATYSITNINISPTKPQQQSRSIQTQAQIERLSRHYAPMSQEHYSQQQLQLSRQS